MQDVPRDVRLRRVELAGPLQPNNLLHKATIVHAELPESLCMHQGDVYVVSTGNSCVYRLDDGQLHRVFCTGG